MIAVLKWLRANPEVGFLTFLLITGTLNAVFHKGTPEAEALLRETHPRWYGVREMLRGAGFDSPKVRSGLSYALLGRYDGLPPIDAQDLPAKEPAVTVPDFPPRPPPADGEAPTVPILPKDKPP